MHSPPMLLGELRQLQRRHAACICLLTACILASAYVCRQLSLSSPLSMPLSLLVHLRPCLSVCWSPPSCRAVCWPVPSALSLLASGDGLARESKTGTTNCQGHSQTGEGHSPSFTEDEACEAISSIRNMAGRRVGRGHRQLEVEHAAIICIRP